MTAGQTGLSPAHTKTGRLQRALLERLDVHVREGTIPTNNRFLFYELEQMGMVSKISRVPKEGCTGTRKESQDLADALLRLREKGIIPWRWIEDETRSMTEWQSAPNVADYLAHAVQYASIDRWGDEPPPFILCESKAVAGALRATARRYHCPIAATGGQAKGFLVTDVALALQANQRVLYLGDFDWCGQQIEENTRRTLIEHAGLPGIPATSVEDRWERVALTAEQAEELVANGASMISKPDRRYKPTRYYDAMECEALGQGIIVGLLRDRLDELMPEPINDVLVREEQQRAEVAEQLRGLR
jgi:hypothetical protein